MELLTFLERIKFAVENLTTLKDFIHNEMAELLLKLGDSQYRAAIDALSQINRSSLPTREVESAITCLRLAYETFYLNAKPSYKDIVLDELGSTFLLSQRASAKLPTFRILLANVLRIGLHKYYKC